MASSARLDELKKKFDENPRRYFAPLANEYRKQGELAQAIALCRTHLPNQPGHISGHIVLAQALYETLELEEARQAFESALELDPENLIALRYLGDIAREQGSTALARTWYQRVLDADPRNEEIAQLLKEVDVTADAARSELASRPTPPVNTAIAEPAYRQESAPSGPSVPQLSFEPAPLPEAEEEEPLAVAQGEAREEDEPAVAEVQETPTAPAIEETVPEPVFDSFTLDLPSPPSEESLGTAPVSPPVGDDWFSQTHEAPHASNTESFFPEFDEPAPEAAPAAPEAPHSEWSLTDEPTAPAAPAGLQDATLEFSVDPESPTGEFTISAAEEFEQQLEAEAASGASEALAADPFGFAAAPEEPAAWEAPTAETPLDEVTAETAAVEEWAAEPASEWTEAPSEPVAGSWESALAPEQLSAEQIPEAPDESVPYLNADPHIGRTPAFAEAIPEEPPAPFVTETMAELYLQQGFNEEAIAIYRQLLAQSPHDESLRRRIEALEQGSESPVVDLSAQPSMAQSVRAFFARFATRSRRHVADAASSLPNTSEPVADAPPAIGGLARREEALTQPDESLTQVFAARTVSTDDAQAAATLASAFGVAPMASNGGELSLETLFREVEARSPGAVTSAGHAHDGPASGTPRQADVESHADIEQFTAWLEGLKKK